jgi:hypothetical protein
VRRLLASKLAVWRAKWFLGLWLSCDFIYILLVNGFFALGREWKSFLGALRGYEQPPKRLGTEARPFGHFFFKKNDQKETPKL